MEPRNTQPAKTTTNTSQPQCECCQDAATLERRVPRRQFLTTGAGLVLGASAIGSVLPAGRVWAQATAAAASAPSTPETLVGVLYEMLSPKQREAICFAWDHQDKERGLLRTHISANWDITDYFVDDEAFYNKDQQTVIRQIYEGIIHPDWHERIDKQLEDDAGGYGVQNSIAIFGEPGSKQFEFVMTGRHMTIRCDGNSADHVAFGGPIFYGHAADTFNEGPTHPGNVFWPQAQAANKLYQMLDGKQQKRALLSEGLPNESRVGFRGKGGEFQGLPVTEMSSDQKEHLQQVVSMLIEHYRHSDRDEFTQCLKTQGGLDACHLAYYAQNDIGKDGVWDIWRLEGPSFVWHYRGAPHVHVWVNMADDPSVKLNA
jgi:F0F1-type ATP synthase membrane subunit c/vacuolar-type H+-ATPase subunit K